VRTTAHLATLGALLVAGCTTPHGERAISRDEPTPLGVTAGEIVAKGEGTLTGTLQWVTLPNPGYPEGFSVPATPTEVTLQTFCGYGESRLVASIEEDSIEIDCWVTVTTADGLLHDTWPGTLLAFKGRTAEPRLLFGPRFGTGWVAHDDVNGTLRETIGSHGWIWLSFEINGSYWGGEVGIAWGQMKDDGTGNWGGGSPTTPLATMDGPVKPH
jgi:hypothetical protein